MLQLSRIIFGKTFRHRLTQPTECTFLASTGPTVGGHLRRWHPRSSRSALGRGCRVPRRLLSYFVLSRFSPERTAIVICVAVVRPGATYMPPVWRDWRGEKERGGGEPRKVQKNKNVTSFRQADVVPAVDGFGHHVQMWLICLTSFASPSPRQKKNNYGENGGR